MLRRQGIRRSYCSTIASPALVMTMVTGFVLPSVAATSAPDDETSNFCAMACGKRGGDVRPDLNWDGKPVATMG
jgi:hypothetical protein